MKKELIIIFMLCFILVGCSSKDTNKEEIKDKEYNQEIKEAEMEEKIEQVSKNNTNSIEDRINETINNMSLDEKIGQLIIISYRNDSVDETLQKVLDEVKPGGFILFKENLTTYDNTIKLIKDIKSTSKIPMFISIDEEGGSVQRLKSLSDLSVSDFPYMYDLARTKDTNKISSVAKAMAEELKVFGINMDFAPDIDVYSNPKNQVIGKRSFGSNPELVSKYGLIFGNSLMNNNIIPVYKHFPGHGNTSIDSHVDLPIVNKSKEELLNSDLIPFINAIKDEASVIMVGHLAVPSITGNNTPASLSKEVITDFLKTELGYKGLVVTDALDMGALTNYYKKEEICSNALLAGVDILLMPVKSTVCVSDIKNKVSSGIISEERINESVRKILELKYSKIENTYNEYLPSSYLNSEDHKNILSKVK